MTAKPSTRSLDALPDINTMRRLCQSIAMLDAVLSPEWESRYYSFNAAWSPGEQMASMRSGSGDDYFILFSAAGAVLKGFSHESPMSPYHHQPPRLWPGLYDGIPPGFDSFLRETAFSISEATFCIWRSADDLIWHCGVRDFADGPDPDGSEELLAIFDVRPVTYQSFAEEYYETEVPLEAVERIYEHSPLTDDLVASLNPDLTVGDLASDVEEISYPSDAE